MEHQQSQPKRSLTAQERKEILSRVKALTSRYLRVKTLAKSQVTNEATAKRVLSQALVDLDDFLKEL